jgi:nucleotide-binding universal stress UspA family protein
MKIQKILWPTDFSENAAIALPYVTSLAQTYDAEIHILYVLKEYVEFGASYGYYDPSDFDKMRQWEKDTASKKLDDVCEKFLNSCPLFIRHLSVGDPAKEILKLIDSEHIDLVVMAGRGSESHFQIGSVVDKVLRCSTAPLLIVPLPACEISQTLK